MGDAEGLVQVEMADIGTNDTWGCQPHLFVMTTSIASAAVPSRVDELSIVGNTVLSL